MESPVFGRASQAALAEAILRTASDAATAAWRADGGRTDLYVVRAVSLAGVRHRLIGVANEDSFAWTHEGPHIALAVADGLGSVPGSAEAAARVAEAAVSATLHEGVDAGVQAANRCAAPSESTTLLVALVATDEVELARVGDSSAFRIHPDGSWDELFSLPVEDRVGTETAALPSGDLEVDRTTTRLETGQVLVLATDGVADPWRDGPATVGPALAGALLEPPPLLELLRLADFSRQGCHDDRTLLCLWRQ